MNLSVFSTFPTILESYLVLIHTIFIPRSDPYIKKESVSSKPMDGVTLRGVLCSLILQTHYLSSSFSVVIRFSKSALSKQIISVFDFRLCYSSMYFCSVSSKVFSSLPSAILNNLIFLSLQYITIFYPSLLNAILNAHVLFLTNSKRLVSDTNSNFTFQLSDGNSIQ